MSVRLRAVAGHESRANDVLFRAAHTPHRHCLVFFGGDVQDYNETMETHRDNRNYMKWSLENTAVNLGQNFPTCHIVLVRPARIAYKSFSCYDNFVPSNDAGAPDHTPTHYALHHLERLLQNVTNRLKSMPPSKLIEAVPDFEEIEATGVLLYQKKSSNGASTQDSSASTRTPLDPLAWVDALALDECRLTLIGFSKGCVVLNQMLYEFHYAKTLTPGDDRLRRFMERIDSMYWLDGGHAGGKNTWLTSRALLETLVRLDVNIYIHVSPYQVKDEGRPWIGREEKAFTSLLKKLGAKVFRYCHDSSNARPSLLTHFSVLTDFKRVQDSVPAIGADSDDDE